MGRFDLLVTTQEKYTQVNRFGVGLEQTRGIYRGKLSWGWAEMIFIHRLELSGKREALSLCHRVQNGPPCFLNSLESAVGFSPSPRLRQQFLSKTTCAQGF